MINTLTLKSLAAFEDLFIDFSPRINVIIGENSCGKTQLLKAAYALNCAQSEISSGSIAKKPEINSFLTQKLLRLFKPGSGKIGGLCNSFSEPKTASLAMMTNANDEEFGFEISSSRASTVKFVGNHKLAEDSGVFIPSKEVLSLLPAIASKSVNDTQLEALFDDTIFDISRRLLVTPPDDLSSRLNEDPRLGSLLPNLAVAIKGMYEIDGERQHFVPGEYTKSSRSKSQSIHAQAYSDGEVLAFTPLKEDPLSIHMTAEGFRKIGVIQGLLANGELNTSGDSPIFWDEPESNMNPKLIKTIVECMLEMSRNGKQVIIATHDYVLLKWLDLLVDADKGDHIRYHSLHRDAESRKISVNTTSNYLDITPNAIDETFEFLINSELDRSFGDLGQ
jgi:energy-coupling factor transporter ATP-binding protein EcfA2